MKIFLVFVLFLTFLFSGRLIAGNCFTIDNGYEITFSGNGNNNCLSNDGLSIYSGAKVGNIGFLRSNGKGFSLSLTFDRDYGNISVGNEVVLFGAYADINGTESLLEIGINSVNNIFVKRPDQKINIDVVGDDDLTSPHSLVLSYNDRRKKLVLTIDGADAIEDNVDAISTEIKKIIIGKNFKGRIAPIYGFSNRLDQIERFNEVDRLAVVYKVPISPLRKVAGILVSKRLCTSTQVKSNGINECVSTTEAFPTQLSVGMNTPAGSSLTKSGTFPLVCDPGFSPSDPPPTYTVDSNGTVISVDGSCNPEDCNITGQAGIANPTNVSYGTGTLQCLTILGYKDSINYNCGSGGVVNITSEPCNLMNASEAIDYIANNASPGDDFTNMIEAIPGFDSSDVETSLGSNSNYSCAIIGVPGIDDQDINYGTTSVACSGLSTYIGSINFNCESGTASTDGGSCTTMNYTQAQDFIINDASPGDDLSAFVSNGILSLDQINTSLASNTNYECIITDEPGIIDDTIIGFGLETLNCVGLLGYTGEAQLDCQDGNVVAVNTSCTPMDDDSAISFLTNDITPGDDISAIAGNLDQDTINSALASNSNFNCAVSSYPTLNFFSNISLPITYGSGQSFACDVGFTGSGISAIDCTSANAIDLSTEGDCTARTYKVDTDFTLPTNSTDPGDITYDVLFLKDGFDTTTINNGVICNNGYESSDGDADNLIRYRFNSSSNADIILKPDVICNPKTYIVVTENPGDFQYILPYNVVNLAITYDASITTDNRADFTCNTGYVADESPPNYYFDGISLITSGGTCIGQTYEAVTDYEAPRNSVDITSISYNANATSDSPINFTCLPGYEAHSDGLPHYYFTESKITIAGGSCIAKTYNVGATGTDLVVANSTNTTITYNPAYSGTSTPDTIGIACSTGYEPSDNNVNGLIQYQFNTSTGDVEMETTESCIAKTYNVGATGTDLVVANSTNTTITYNPAYDVAIGGSLSPENSGIDCSGTYGPSDNNVNGLIQYQFNNGEIEIESGVTCIPAQVTVSTFATGISNPFGITVSGNTLYAGRSGNSSLTSYDINASLPVTGSSYGNGSFDLNRQMVADASGNLYVARVYGSTNNSNSHYVVKVDTGGNFSNFMGDGSAGGGLDSKKMQHPFAITISGNDIYSVSTGTDMAIKKKSISSSGSASDNIVGIVSAGCSVGSLAADSSGNIYVLCHDTYVIKKINSGTSTISPFAGTNNSTGSNDGALLNAKFNFDRTGGGDEWKHINGMVYHPGHNALYIADGGNHLIRKIDLSTNQVSTIAGTAGTTGSTDGQGLSQAKFNKPGGITVDSNGNLYVSDNENNSIRKLSW